MSEKDNGGPAFPTVDANRDEDYGTRGMTIRDYLAAKAMQGYLSTDRGQGELPSVVAESAYFLADAMLKARNE